MDTFVQGTRILLIPAQPLDVDAPPMAPAARCGLFTLDQLPHQALQTVIAGRTAFEKTDDARPALEDGFVQRGHAKIPVTTESPIFWCGKGIKGRRLDELLTTMRVPTVPGRPPRLPVTRQEWDTRATFGELHKQPVQFIDERLPVSWFNREISLAFHNTNVRLGRGSRRHDVRVFFARDEDAPVELMPNTHVDIPKTRANSVTVFFVLEDGNIEKTGVQQQGPFWAAMNVAPKANENEPPAQAPAVAQEPAPDTAQKQTPPAIPAVPALDEEPTVKEKVTPTEPYITPAEVFTKARQQSEAGEAVDIPDHAVLVIGEVPDENADITTVAYGIYSKQDGRVLDPVTKRPVSVNGGAWLVTAEEALHAGEVLLGKFYIKGRLLKLPHPGDASRWLIIDAADPQKPVILTTFSITETQDDDETITPFSKQDAEGLEGFFLSFPDQVFVMHTTAQGPGLTPVKSAADVLTLFGSASKSGPETPPAEEAPQTPAIEAVQAPAGSQTGRRKKQTVPPNPDRPQKVSVKDRRRSEAILSAAQEIFNDEKPGGSQLQAGTDPALVPGLTQRLLAAQYSFEYYLPETHQLQALNIWREVVTAAVQKIVAHRLVTTDDFGALDKTSVLNTLSGWLGQRVARIIRQRPGLSAIGIAGWAVKARLEG